ncbi:MAG: hypothetical protein JOY96_11175, partial [Verrucomicrobia bacterium]|nr:hypothetical protein [Verrucomicrobiota bacterium]
METLTCVSESPIPEPSAMVGSPESVIRELLATKIAELPDVSKKILAIRYERNASFEEIAACLNLPEATIRQTHNELINRLRDYVFDVRTPAVINL